MNYEPMQGAFGPEQPGIVISSVTFPDGPENYVTIEIADTSGQPVMGKIVQEGDVALFCGSTDEPVRIHPGFAVTVQIHDGRCFGGGASVATGGVIKATFVQRSFQPTESKRYSAGGSQSVGTDDPMPLARTADVSFLPAGRRHVRLAIEDESGTRVAAKVVQEAMRSQLFCGSTSKSIAVNPKLPFQVVLFSGACAGSHSVVTDGTVTATFLKRR
ncbi:MAG: hypothetical protein ACRDI3_01510 [Actinomycetota bacterium]